MGPVRIRHSSHDFGWQSSHFVDLAGWQAKLASIEIWIPWRNAHKPHLIESWSSGDRFTCIKMSWQPHNQRKILLLFLSTSIYVIESTWSQCEAPFMYVKPRSVHDHNLCIACTPATCTVSWAHPFLMSEVWYLKHIYFPFFFFFIYLWDELLSRGHWGFTVWADDLCWPWDLCKMRS